MRNIAPTSVRLLRLALMFAALVVAQAPCWALIPSSPNCSGSDFQFYAQSAYFSATLPGNATGTVTFLDGGRALATVSVSPVNSTYSLASFTTSSLAVGTHQITCTYSGDATYAPGSAPPFTINIEKAHPQCSPVSTRNPAAAGEALSISVTVTNMGGVPTGTVTLMDGAAALAMLPLLALSNGAVGVYNTSSLSAGRHTITASYPGDANFTACMSSQPLVQVISLNGTTTTIQVSSTLFDYGQPIAVGVGVAGNAAGTPTGQVTVSENALTLGNGVLNSGKASVTVTNFAPGSHTLVANYVGDGRFGASSSTPYTISVAGAPTSTQLSSQPNPALPAQTITLTANVSASSGLPTGTVTFRTSTAAIGTAALNASGQATYSTSFAQPGSMALTALYSGDAKYSSSLSSALTQIVQQGSTSIALSSSPNPVAFGQPVTFTATLRSGNAAATGNIVFKDNDAALATAAANSSGVATWTTASLSAGPHNITASYAGNDVFAGSISAPLQQNVIAPNPAIAIVLSASGKAPVAPGSIVSIYGEALAPDTVVAATLPLTTTLGGVTVTFLDAAGVARNSPLIFVSPGQINCLVPADTIAGSSTVSVSGSLGGVNSGVVNVAAVAPALYSADGSGTGPAAALAETLRRDGTVVYQYTFKCDTACAPLAIDLGSPDDQTTLVLFGTGIKNAASVNIRVGEAVIPASYAGAQGQFPGLDQVNVPLPQSLRGHGDVNVIVDAGNQPSNVVLIRIQ